MAIRNFYPEAYIKAGATPFVMTTQELLDTELASNWTHIGACESGGILEEAPGKKIEIMNGQNLSLSNIINGKVVVLECTKANYDFLRLTFHNKACSILLNESYGTTGVAVQRNGIYPIINKEGKSGDMLKISISFKLEAKDAAITLVDLS